jgi:secretion/DNA translocation related TadE-like protein
MSRHRRSARQAGSVSILAAGTLFLAGILSLVTVDILRALQAKGRAQTAADAAALAAAQELAIPSGVSPEEVAADYAGRNGATLVTCTCAPGSSEAVVEVEVQVVLVFVGGDRTVHARARAVIEGAKRGLMGTIARDAATRSSRAPPPPRRSGLLAGQAGADTGLPPGAPLPARYLRRAPRAHPRCALSGCARQPSLPSVSRLRAPPACLRVRRRATAEQRAGARDPGRARPRRSQTRRRLLRRRGVHGLQLEPSGRSFPGSNSRLTVQNLGCTDPSISNGSVAITTVPDPLTLRTVNVPPASSARSRMEARPTRPLARKSLASAGSNP